MCTVCHGTGCPCCEIEAPPCPHCNGNGELYYHYHPDNEDTPVSYQHYLSLSPHEQYRETCPHCKGSGISQQDPAELEFDYYD